MEAWQYESTTGGLEKNLKLSHNAQKPAYNETSTDTVLIEVLSAGINPVDYKLPEAPLVAKYVIGTPASPGFDFSGRIAKSGNTSYKPGQLVFGKLDGPAKFGAIAQYLVAPVKGITPLPASVSANDGAAVGCAGLTAYQAIVPYAKKGGWVFINGGSGGVGTFAIQIAKLVGFNVVTSCSSANVQMCKDLGADEVIDYKKTDVLAELKKGGQRFDHVVDLAGQPSDLHKSSPQFLKPEGVFVEVAGGFSWETVRSVIMSLLLPVFLGGTPRKWKFMMVSTNAKELAHIGEWMASGEMKAVLDSVLPFEQAPQAFDKLKTGRARGKIIIQVQKT